MRKWTHSTSNGLPAHDMTSLMSDLTSRSGATHLLGSKDIDLTFKQMPGPTPLQRIACEVLGLLPLRGK
jgi:hypothetical protein